MDNRILVAAAQWGASQAQQTTADAGRVLEWMRTPNRKPANLAFTDGPERQAAYWIEIAQQRVAQQTTEPELPEPEAIRHSFDGYGYLYTDSGSGSLWKERAGCMPDAEPIYTAAQMHEHYAAGVRAGMAQSQWISVTERLPEPRERVVGYGYVYTPSGWSGVGLPYKDEAIGTPECWGVRAVYLEAGLWQAGGCGCEITHWMPLPTPPAVQGGQQ